MSFGSHTLTFCYALIGILGLNRFGFGYCNNIVRAFELDLTIIAIVGWDSSQRYNVILGQCRPTFIC